MRANTAIHGALDRLLAPLFWATLALLFARPSFLRIPTPLGTLSLTSARNIALIFCAAWLAAAVLAPRRLRGARPFLPPVALFVGWSALSAALSPFGPPRERWSAVLEALLYAVFFCAALDLLAERPSRRRAVIRLLFPVAAGVAVVNLSRHYARGTWFIMDQDYPMWDGKNAFGLFMAMSLAAASSLAPAARGARRAVPFAAGLAALALGVLYSYSRGAWLGLAAAIGVLFSRMRPWKCAAILAAAALTLALLPTRRMAQRFFATGGERDRNLARRMAVWDGALRMMRDRPLLGVGPGEFRTACDRYLGEPPPGTPVGRRGRPIVRYREHAHNLFLQVGAETGLPGLGALLWGTAAVAVAARGRFRRARGAAETALAAGLLAALAAFLAFSLVDSSWAGRFSGSSFMHINLIAALLAAALAGGDG
ncbi:MAG: O-antigen ligase family protein [bacterium]|nr:O-antigen ligase family protein [bacterium]